MEHSNNSSKQDSSKQGSSKQCFVNSKAKAVVIFGKCIRKPTFNLHLHQMLARIIKQNRSTTTTYHAFPASEKILQIGKANVDSPSPYRGQHGAFEVPLCKLTDTFWHDGVWFGVNQILRGEYGIENGIDISVAMHGVL